MAECPFCKSDKVIPVNNVQNKHWLYCTECGAAGPQKDSADEAVAAFAITASSAGSILSRWVGKRKEPK